MLVEDFIFRVEKLQRSYACPWREIENNFHHLLEGQAANWYWLHIKDRPNINWMNMRLDLAQKFKKFYTDLDVIRRIMDRVQLRDEKSNDFIDAIMCLRTQLRDPLPDYQIVDLIKKNLRPKLASLIFATQIYSVEHLRSECRKAEELVEHELQQRARMNYPVRTVNELSWQDYDDPVLPVEELRIRSNGPNVKLNFNRDQDKCWNCKSIGHTFKHCTSDQRSLFCYRCGSPGVVTPRCPKCQSGNRMTNANDGESRSTQTID